MAEIEYVKKVDKFIKLKYVLVSCTDKRGLISNIKNYGDKMEGIPVCGVLGFIKKMNPDVLFISTGGTFQLIKAAGLNVIEVSEWTGYPEMKSGLVKSLHPTVHAGILAHKYTESDNDYMGKQKLKYIDAVIVNFYNLVITTKREKSSFEMIRQTIDVGGPTMSHNARKAFISTVLITNIAEYKL